MSYTPGITHTSSYEKCKALAHSFREDRKEPTNPYLSKSLEELQELSVRARAWLENPDHDHHPYRVDGVQKEVWITEAIKKHAVKQTEQDVVDALF